MIVHPRFIFRQITRSGKQAVVLILCVTLSILTLVALNGFGESIRQAMFRDARALHGADVIVQSRSAPVSRPVQDRIANLEREGRVRSLKIHDFYSMVRPEGMENPVLADIKVVEPGYPFYGEVALKSGKTLRDVLTAGNIVVEQGLLDRLHIAVGDRLRIGDAVLDVRDVVVRESNRPVNFLSFGPRIFVAAADLERLGLVRQGSRVTRSILIKVSGEETPEAVAADLRALADADMEQVETCQSARSRIRRFFDNFLFFLSLSAVFVLLLSGIGIHSALTAFLREKEQAIAILKALGGTGNFIRRNFLAVVFIFGSIGTIAGIACGLGLQFALPSLFGDLLPPDMKIVVSWQAVGEGAFLGLMVTGLFTFLPLHRLKQIRPGAVFRRERGVFRHGLPFYLNVAVILLFFTLTVLRYLEDRETGLWVIAGIGLLAGVMSLMTWLVLSGLRRLKIKNLAVRQALRGLFRTGSATGPAIVTLAASIGLICTIWLVEKNLDAAFINSYPPDAPNLFFIDIQPDQVTDFSKTLGPDLKKPPQYYPVIRARLLSVNDEKIDRNAEHSRKTGDNLARPFNLTYRDNLLEDERMLDGKSLFRDDLKGLQVSVLDTVVKMKPMKTGDRLRFRIQGIPVDAVISSIRTRNQTSVKPFFYFVFPENSVVRTAPQTIFCAVRVEKEQLADVRFGIVSAFPNVSVIDVSETLASFAGIMHRLSLVIRFFTGFSIAAGILMIVSSILATRFARLQEAVYFRILGAKSRFVTAVFALEHIFIGLTSGIMGIGMAQIATNILCTRIFETDYAPHLAESFLMLAGTVGMVLAVGLAASIPVLRQKPVVFLREAA